MIRDARNAQPAPNWVSSRDSDLRLAEMRVAQALGEPSRMLAAAEIYLNGDAERSRTALDFARAFYAKGDQSSAIALVNLMLRRSPDDEAARKLMAEWRPRPAQRKSAEPKPED